MSYTVPSGWANAVDDPNFYNLVSRADYAKTVSDQTRLPGIVLLPDVDVAAQDEACSPSVEPGVGHGSEAMAARIALMSSLDVGAASPISVSGMPGLMLDVALKEGWTQSCGAGGGVPVLRQGGKATDGLDGWDRRMTAAGHWRLILLDVAEGRTMAVVIDTFADPSRYDDLVAQAMPIITSFELHLPAP